MAVPARPSVARVIVSLEEEEVWESLREVYSVISERLAEVLAPFGLAIVEYRTLRICSSGPVRATDLTRRLGLTPSGGTELIDRLERRGLVKRTENATDRRSVLVVLTSDGHRLVGSARAARRAYLRRLARAMPRERQVRLKSELDALRAALREGPPL
jgi:DNA-binding MarR family transcriptional regulator